MRKSIYDHFAINADGMKIIKKEATYTRTASGKSWKKKPESVEEKTVDARFYNNYVQSIPFFNNWGDGAYCRANWGYTYVGYIPVHVVTVSPYRDVKKDVWFTFKLER